MMESFFWRKLIVRFGLARWFPSIRNHLNGAEEWLPYLSDRALAFPLIELQQPSLLPEIHTPDSIDLALRTPPIEHGGAWSRSPETSLQLIHGQHELRQELAYRMDRDHGRMNTTVDDVLLMHGASAGFAAIIDCFINPGDPVVLFEPCSPLFSIGLKHRRAAIRWVPCTATSDGLIRFQREAFTRAIRGAKMIVLADPNNPTGGTFAAEDLEQIAFWTAKNQTIIVHDVSFDRWRGERPMSRLAGLPNTGSRLITLGSFTKSHGLTGVRLGWMIAEKTLIRVLSVSALLNAPLGSSLAQDLALTALRNEDSSLPNRIEAQRKFTFERLQQCQLQPWPSRGGIFHWLPVPTAEPAERFAQRLLTSTGVLVQPGTPFGPNGRGFIRISHVTTESRLREGLTRLQAFLMAENNKASG